MMFKHDHRVLGRARADDRLPAAGDQIGGDRIGGKAPHQNRPELTVVLNDQHSHGLKGGRST
jgi:hypothetical protein